MKWTLLFWATGFLLVAIGWRIVEACSCAYRHPQTQYCDADFVVLAVPKYVKQVDSGSTPEYTVKLQKIFKANSAARNALRKRKIYSGGPCIVILNIGLTFVLIGKIYNGRPYVDSCSFNTPWSSFPSERRDQLIRFKHACSCTIDTCNGPIPCNKTESTCVFNNSLPDSFNCYTRFGVCRKNKWGECDWVRSRYSTHYSALAKCLNTTIAYI